jgi:hypothetical protein
MGNNRCPLCNDDGLNHTHNRKTNNEILKQTKVYSKKPEAPTQLVNWVNELEKLENSSVQIRRDIRTHRKKEGIFVDLLKAQRRLWTKNNRITVRIWDLKRAIVSIFPIKNLIIITRMEIKD